jgi:hypothetical protein
VSLLSLSAPAPVSCNPTCGSPPPAAPTHRPPSPRSHTSFAAAADPHAGPYPLPPHIVLPPHRVEPPPEALDLATRHRISHPRPSARPLPHPLLYLSSPSTPWHGGRAGAAADWDRASSPPSVISLLSALSRDGAPSFRRWRVSTMRAESERPR